LCSYGTLSFVEPQAEGALHRRALKRVFGPQGDRAEGEDEDGYIMILFIIRVLYGILFG
jgi:hypothetical protein